MKFEEWFKAQFGEWPSKRPLWELAQDYEDAKRVFLVLKEIHDKQVKIEEQYRVARYAWNVQDKDKYEKTE